MGQHPGEIQVEYGSFYAFLGKIWAKLAQKWRKKRGLSANGKILDNSGRFWCKKHWKVIVDSQISIETAIDPAIAVMGIGRALDIKYDHELEGPLKGACEMLPREIVDGILEKSRGWL